MTETSFLALLGVVGTLGGTLGGAIIAGVYTGRQVKVQRRHALHDAARRLVVDTLVSARRWRDSVVVISLMAVRAPTPTDFDNWLNDELAQREAELEERVNDFRRSSVEARLLIADGPLSDAILGLHGVHHAWWEDVIEAARKSYDTGAGPDQREALWDAYVTRFSAAIEKVGQLAKRAISVDL